VLLGGLLGTGAAAAAFSSTDTPDEEFSMTPAFAQKSEWWKRLGGGGSGVSGFNAEAVVGRLGEIHRSILRWDARLVTGKHAHHLRRGSTEDSPDGTPIAYAEASSDGLLSHDPIPAPHGTRTESAGTSLLTSWSAFRALVSVRGLVRELGHASPRERNISDPAYMLQGPITPAAGSLTQFASRFYWSEVPDRWRPDDARVQS